MSKTFFGQPRQLSTLFHIELWERFSFYGMNSILAMYLYHSVTKGGLGFSEAVGGSIATAYGGSVYLSTIFGGWVADRILGAERTLFYSGVLVMLGHIALALIPGVSGMIAGLVCIALGSGGVKSSASTMVGSLYENDEWRARRDAGFSIFYIAINIGGMLGPLLTGILQENIGFHYGFGLAAIGMAFGLWRYNHGRKELPKLTAPNPLPANQRAAAAVIIAAVALTLIAAVHFDKINVNNYSRILLITIIVATLGYFARLLLDPRVDSDHRRYIIAYIPLLPRSAFSPPNTRSSTASLPSISIRSWIAPSAASPSPPAGKTRCKACGLSFSPASPRRCGRASATNSRKPRSSLPSPCSSSAAATSSSCRSCAAAW